jgi:hypothetical protein
MSCRHNLSPKARRTVLTLNVLVLAAKLTELAIVLRERRRNDFRLNIKKG